MDAPVAGDLRRRELRDVVVGEDGRLAVPQLAPDRVGLGYVLELHGPHADGGRVVRGEEREDARAPGQDKGDSTSLQRECSARARSGKKHPRFESAPRDDRSSKNQPKRVENGRDMSL